MAIDKNLVAKYQAAKTDSEKLTFTESLILLFGPPGAGKTTLLLTASEKFAGLPHKGERIFCDDLCLIQVDPAASDGFKSAGYKCHVINYRDILKDVGDPLTALMTSIGLASETGAKYF